MQSIVFSLGKYSETENREISKVATIVTVSEG